MSRGTWGSAELIEADDTGDAEYPRVAIDGSGNAIAVWHQSDGTWLNIRSNRYVAGAGWGTPQSIEAGNLGDAKFPRVAVDGNGNAIAVWQASDGTHTNIRANRYVAGTGWGTAQLIETGDAGPAIDPQIAINAGGYGIAVWTHSDGARYNINAVRFE